jgi:ABC-type multidrug transport system fused ATPase/permease subunit
MKTLLRVLKYGKKWRWQFYLVLVLLVTTALIGLVLPIAVRELLNSVENIMDFTSLPAKIWILAAFLVGIYLIGNIASVFSNIIRRSFAEHIVSEIRCDVYSHLQTLTPRFYSDKQVGQISSRVMENVKDAAGLLAGILPEMIIGILQVIGVAVVLFFLNPLLAGIALVPFVFIFVVSLFLKKGMRYFEKAKKASGELYGMLSDNLQGMREIQIFGKHEYELERFSKKQDEFYKNRVRATSTWVSLWGIMDFLSKLATVAVIVVGAYLAMIGNLGAGDIIAFIMYIGVLYGPVSRLGDVMNDASDTITSISRTFEYLDCQSEIKDKPGALVAENLYGNIEFKNVAFGYKEARVLENVSFTADAGQMIALVGETGSGKTTIASLIARFYDVESGSISIDGIDIRDYTLQSLRNHLSFVLQDVFLFNGTIAENIAYGSTGTPTEQEIIKVAKFACIHNFIDTLPEKYETRIGERGVKLSGGQKQRLAIARALLRNSPIIVLDEATSSIDNTTEKEIQKAIEKLSQDKTRTIIVIAHRLSTIEKADKILYIDKAKIAEQGTHEELLAKNGAYAKLRSKANI